MNKIILLGRLTKDPEIVRSSKETMIGRFTIAVPRKYVKEGEERKTDFINIVTFGKLTEFAGKFFKKGQQVLVTGRLEINSYEDENNEKRYSTQVICEELDFADSKKEENNAEESNKYDELYENVTFTEPNNDNSNDDDLPF